MSQHKTGFETINPNDPISFVRAIPNIMGGEYGTILGILAAYGAWWCWKEFKGPPNLKGSAYWAKPEHIKRAKQSVLELQASPVIHDFGYQIGNVPVTDACTSIFSFGAPKTGKSLGVVNALIYEHLKKGLPQVIVDLQYPVQTSIFVAAAQQLGYQPEDIHLFVPGEKESEVWNMAEFASGSRALAMAGMLQANFSSKDAKNDDFFTPAGKQLIAAVLSLAHEFPELNGVMGCQSVLRYDDLPDRLKSNLEKLEGANSWMMSRFNQYLSTSKSDKTASSIAGTASNLFGQFCDEEIAPALVGKTSFPLYLEGKKLLIIGCTPRLRRVVSPLLMALLGLIIEENAVHGRKTQLQIAIDELPAISYPDLVFHINELRKFGVFFNLAAQTITQMRSQFGENDTESIMTGTGTTFWFNPRSNVSAEYLSDILGEKIWKEKQYTTGSSGGKGSSSVSSQTKEKKLLPPHEIRKLKQGQAVVLTRLIESKTQAYIPWKVKIKPDPTYMKMCRWAEGQWDFTRSKLTEYSPQLPADNSLLINARKAADALLPSKPTEASSELKASVVSETQAFMSALT